MLLSPEVLNRLTTRTLSTIRYIVIHHTADNDQAKDIEEIAREEIAAQGFSTVGYHFVIWSDGKIQTGRPITKVPAANLGLNTPSVAISLEGNFHPPDTGYKGEKPTPEAIHSAITIINEWVKPKCPNLRYLIGHRDVARIVEDQGDATACPGDLLQAQLPVFRQATGLKAE